MIKLINTFDSFCYNVFKESKFRSEKKKTSLFFYNTALVIEKVCKKLPVIRDITALLLNLIQFDKILASIKDISKSTFNQLVYILIFQKLCSTQTGLTKNACQSLQKNQIIRN